MCMPQHATLQALGSVHLLTLTTIETKYLSNQLFKVRLTGKFAVTRTITINSERYTHK